MWQNSPLLYWLTGYEQKRKAQLKKVAKGPLHDFLSTPFPPPNTPFNELPMLAVDFETTGLNAISDKLLSVGCVEINQSQIQLRNSYHQIINIEQALTADNVVIHQITDTLSQQGLPLAQVVEDLLSRLSGRVMVVHFARIEREFLREACMQLYGAAPVIPTIDTLLIAKRKLDMRDTAYDPSQLRLESLRHHHKLPPHYGHNALNDAIATAELLFAQVNKAQKRKQMSLTDILY